MKLLLKYLQMQIKDFLCLLVIVFLIYLCSYQIKTRFVLNKYNNFIPEPRTHKHHLVEWLINEKWLDLKDLPLYNQTCHVIALDWM